MKNFPRLKKGSLVKVTIIARVEEHRDDAVYLRPPLGDCMNLFVEDIRHVEPVSRRFLFCKQGSVALGITEDNSYEELMAHAGGHDIVNDDGVIVMVPKEYFEVLWVK